MKNLYEPATTKEIRERIARLGPANQRQWGKMNAAQAMAHCAITMEWAVGDKTEPRMFLGRIFGPMVKSMTLKDEKPMGKNAPTAKSLVIQGDCDLGKECARLSALVERFAAAGPQGCTKNPHT